MGLTSTSSADVFGRNLDEIDVWGDGSCATLSATSLSATSFSDMKSPWHPERRSNKIVAGVNAILEGDDSESGISSGSDVKPLLSNAGGKALQLFGIDRNKVYSENSPLTKMGENGSRPRTSSADCIVATEKRGKQDRRTYMERKPSGRSMEPKSPKQRRSSMGRKSPKSSGRKLSKARRSSMDQLERKSSMGRKLSKERRSSMDQLERKSSQERRRSMDQLERISSQERRSSMDQLERAQERRSSMDRKSSQERRSSIECKTSIERRSLHSHGSQRNMIGKQRQRQDNLSISEHTTSTTGSSRFAGTIANLKKSERVHLDQLSVSDHCLINRSLSGKSLLSRSQSSSNRDFREMSELPNSEDAVLGFWLRKDSNEDLTKLKSKFHKLDMKF